MKNAIVIQPHLMDRDRQFDLIMLLTVLKDTTIEGEKREGGRDEQA